MTCIHLAPFILREPAAFYIIGVITYPPMSRHLWKAGQAAWARRGTIVVKRQEKMIVSIQAHRRNLGGHMK